MLPITLNNKSSQSDTKILCRSTSGQDPKQHLDKEFAFFLVEMISNFEVGKEGDRNGQQKRPRTRQNTLFNLKWKDLTNLGRNSLNGWWAVSSGTYSFRAVRNGTGFIWKISLVLFFEWALNPFASTLVRKFCRGIWEEVEESDVSPTKSLWESYILVQIGSTFREQGCSFEWNDLWRARTCKMYSVL